MNDKIKCPNCSFEFDVEEALSGKIEAHFKKEYEKKIQEQSERFKSDREKLEKEKEKFESLKEDHDKAIINAVEDKLEKEKLKLEQKLQEEHKDKLEGLERENEERKNENRELKKKEVELLQKEAKLKEQQEDMELNLKKKMLEEEGKIVEKAKQQERESFELERLELQKKIDDNKKLADEMRRKAEQGSMQLQGEIQEIAIENLLNKEFPFDKIDEVPKGIRGADCIQTVVNKFQQECGSIVFESKRTKNFASDWIGKIKQDQVACKADIAVIVTETFPSDMSRFGQIDGVWICGFHEVKSVVLALRQILIQAHSVKSSESNKGEKMELLYEYLTSNEFGQTVQRIIENYEAMDDQLKKEKRAMEKIWKEREKQNWAVQENVAQLFGAIKGIAGKSIPTIEILELPEPDSD